MIHSVYEEVFSPWQWWDKTSKLVFWKEKRNVNEYLCMYLGLTYRNQHFYYIFLTGPGVEQLQQEEEFPRPHEGYLRPHEGSPRPHEGSPRPLEGSPRPHEGQGQYSSFCLIYSPRNLNKIILLMSKFLTLKRSAFRRV